MSGDAWCDDPARIERHKRAESDARGAVNCARYGYHHATPPEQLVRSFREMVAYARGYLDARDEPPKDAA